MIFYLLKNTGDFFFQNMERYVELLIEFPEKKRIEILRYN